MKNTRYVKIQVSFVLCYDEPMDTVPGELRDVQGFLRGGVEAAIVADRPNRRNVYICPYAKMSASLIHAPRGLPQALAQTAEGVQAFVLPESRPKVKEKTMRKARKARKARKGHVRGG